MGVGKQPNNNTELSVSVDELNTHFVNCVQPIEPAIRNAHLQEMSFNINNPEYDKLYFLHVAPSMMMIVRV